MQEAAKTSIQVIDRMMDLIDVLSSAGKPVNLKELSKLTTLHPSTAHRILNALAHYRIIDRVDTGSYKLGTRLLELGNITRHVSMLEKRHFLTCANYINNFRKP